MEIKRQVLCVLAAALAAGGTIETEELMERSACCRARVVGGESSGEEVELPIAFERGADMTREGYLKTTHDYAIRIDRVFLDPRHTDLHESDASEEEAGEGVSVEQEPQLAFMIDGVRVEGRVFDVGEGGERLPSEGVAINAQLPVEVSMRRERRVRARQPWLSEEVMAVEFALPTQAFDSVDWEQLGG